MKNRIEKLGIKRKNLEEELQGLRTELKNQESKMVDLKKKFAQEKNDLLRETQTFSNKEKHFQNELRKKENMIKSSQDRLSALQTKQINSKNVTQIIIGGQLDNPGSNFYSGAHTDFQNLINESEKHTFEKLKKENDLLRTSFMELQTMMVEIVKIRKSICEKTLGGVNLSDSQFLTDLKKELFNVQANPMSTGTLIEMRNNVKKFRNFMDKLDSFKFNVPLNQAYKFKYDSDIDEIKNINKLKDLLSKFFINSKKTTKLLLRTKILLLETLLQSWTRKNVLE